MRTGYSIKCLNILRHASEIATLEALCHTLHHSDACFPLLLGRIIELIEHVLRDLGDALVESDLAIPVGIHVAEEFRQELVDSGLVFRDLFSGAHRLADALHEAPHLLLVEGTGAVLVHGVEAPLENSTNLFPSSCHDYSPH